MENTLEGFGGWHDTSAETDFFSQEQIIEEDKTDAKSVVEQISQEDIKEEKIEVETESNLFDEKVEAENIIDESKEDKDVPESLNISVLNALKEKGFIDYELEEGEELTEDLAEELIEEKFEESVDNKVKELLNELPDLAKQLIQYSIKGGNVNDFISTVTSDASIKLDIDLEKEENQILVLKQLLKLEDKDDEEIETEIEYLKDSNKLKLISEKKFNKYKSEVNNRQKELLEEQAEEQENQKKLIKESKNKISTFLSKTEELDGIKFSKEDKKVLPSYMNDKTVKLQNGTTITQMQKELFYDLPKNEKALIQLATLLKNRNEDGSFNFDSIVKSTKTKVVQEVRQELRRNKSSIPGNSTTQSKQSDKSLADYFMKN